MAASGFLQSERLRGAFDMAKARKLWNEFDADKSGTLSRREVLFLFAQYWREVLQSSNPPVLHRLDGELGRRVEGG